MRRHRLACPLAAAAAVLIAACMTMAAAPELTPSAAAQVWTVPAGEKVFPSSNPGASTTAAVNAAGGEYEGFQIALSGAAARHASVSWTGRTVSLLAENSALYRVGFVRVARPSTQVGGRPGFYPDPLIPESWGSEVTAPAGSSSFYVLISVPYGTKAGIYNGVLHVVNGAETTDLPVSLRVWGFGWHKLSTRTAFLVNLRNIQRSIKGSGVSWSPQTQSIILTNFYRMMQQHGLSPMMPNVLPSVSSRGHINRKGFARSLSPFLGSSGLDLSDAQVPWINWYPQKPWRRTLGSRALKTYLRELFSVYKSNGWQDKAYVFITDEPTKTWEERAAERYARAAHAASARSGFRVRYLLTDDPRPRAVTSHPCNSFLFDDVDIWCTRYYYFFGRVPALRIQQNRGKEIWWYPYANKAADKVPDFAVEEPFADQRVWGWLMQDWNVDGMLYWSINRWGNPVTGGGWRDPFKDPLSYRNRAGRVSNGEGSLLYPGYAPKQGLKDPYAAPVSSLRLEALRDGFEDREYAKLAAATPGGAGFVDEVIATVTWFPYPVSFGHYLRFPKYVTDPATFDTARCQLAGRIEESLR